MAKFDAFDKTFSALCELHGKEPSVAFCHMYRRALVERLGFDASVKALDMAFSRKTYGFPKPYELIEWIAGNGEEKALLAWEDLLGAIQTHGSNASVCFADTRITRYIEGMGGWLEVCLWMVDELKFRRAEFVKAYPSLLPLEAPKSLAGRHELSNSARGFVDFIPKPVMIGAFDSTPERKSLPEAQVQQVITVMAEKFGSIPQEGEERA